MSDAPTPIRQADLYACPFAAWITHPRDGGAPSVFINQNDAIAYQDAHPQDDVNAVIGVAPWEPAVAQVQVLSGTSYPVSGTPNS